MEIRLKIFELISIDKNFRIHFFHIVGGKIA